MLDIGLLVFDSGSSSLLLAVDALALARGGDSELRLWLRCVLSAFEGLLGPLSLALSLHAEEWVVSAY